MIKLNKLPITPEKYAYIGARLGLQLDLRKDVSFMEREGYTNSAIVLHISNKCNKMLNMIYEKGIPY